MKHSEQFAKLAVALIKAQAEFKPIAKSAANPFYKSKYAPLDAVLGEVLPVLARHGMALVQGVTTPESDASAHVTAITVESTLIHESGEWLSTAVVMPLAKADPQGAGGAVTFGRRYGVSALLSLATEDDDDGNVASRPAKRSEGKGGPANARQGAEPESGAPTTQPRLDQTKVMPFGKTKGTPLTDMHQDQLAAALAWAKEKNPTAYAAFITTVETMLDDLRVGS